MRQPTMQGGASVLIVLIMISLTTFGVLALVSAHSDLKLARKNATFMQEYYQLETQAESALNDLSGALASNADERKLTSLGWEVQRGEQTRLFMDVSKGLRHLEIMLELTPKQGEGFKIISWKQVQKEFDYSAGEKLWDGKPIEE